MSSFDVSEYNEASRETLGKVIEALQEQFFASGHHTQFWFFPAQVSDQSLTEPIISKWLKVLSSKGALHFYEVTESNFEIERAIAVSSNRLIDNYKWDPEIPAALVAGTSPHHLPCFAIDIRNTDLEQLIQLVARNRAYSKFYKDALDRFYYDTAPLEGINNSPLRKALLSELLVSRDHIMSVQRAMDILLDDISRAKGIKFSEEEQAHYSQDPENHAKRNRAISEIKKALRNISHDVDIKTHKQGHKANYYELICLG